MNKKVIYTSIIGKYDSLTEPKYIPKGYDFICFTDQDIDNPNSIWEIRKVLPLYKDDTRTARKYKILPHRFLPEYDLSIWVDGNEIIVGDVDKLQEKYLGNKNNNWKDNPKIIENQINKYFKEGYPPNNGLIVSGVMFRKHNKKDIIDCMELWWEELKYGSKRDQLSFNYTSWKCGTSFNWVNQDIRDDGYVLEVKHNKHK